MKASKNTATMRAILTLIIIFANFDALVTSLDEFSEATYKFAASVYQSVSDKGKNIIFSPLSAEIILALTQSGAKGATREELRKVLNLPDNLGPIQELLNSQNGYTIKSANKLYVGDDLAIKDEFKEKFGNNLATIDFTKKEEAARIINQWVGTQTANKITHLIDPVTLDPSTKALLLNALYFKGSWTVAFDSKLTTKEDFYLNPTKVIKVPTMHYTTNVKLAQNFEIGAQFLELGYKGGNEVTMTFVLPYEGDGMETLERHLDQVFSKPSYTEQEVKVALPKFKIETKLDFKEILKNLGIKKIFDVSEADLSGIAGEKGDLVISEVVQKAFIEVNEEGAEAAAATGVASGGARPMVPPEPEEFKADHPFIFYLTIKNIIAFAGKVSIPNYN